MPRRTKETQIKELKEEIERYKSYLEEASKRNKELVDSEEDTFLHSPTYLQMQEEIKFLKSLNKMNEYHLASAQGRFHKINEDFRQVYEDNKRFIEHSSDKEYFVGITENWRDAREYQKLKYETLELKGKIEQKDLSIADRDSEIERLRKELAEIIVSQKYKNETLRSKAGRKKNSESEKHKRDMESFRELIKSQKSINEIIETMNISRATYFRYKKEVNEEATKYDD